MHIQNAEKNSMSVSKGVFILRSPHLCQTFLFYWKWGIEKQVDMTVFERAREEEEEQREGAEGG